MKANPDSTLPSTDYGRAASCRGVRQSAASYWVAILAGFYVAMLTGCRTGEGGNNVTTVPVDQDGKVRRTLVEAKDLVHVTRAMAKQMLALPTMANSSEIAYVRTDPVINDTRDRSVRADIFTDRLRAQLNQNCQNKIMFLARERWTVLVEERNMKRQKEVTSSSDPFVQEFKGADLFLTGKLSGLPTSSKQGVSDYILYTFQLIDARTSVIVWEGMYEVKKEAREDDAYR